MYTSAVDSLLRNGTTCACYYATMHVQPSILLAEVCHAKGQRAFVGKVMSLWTLTYLFLFRETVDNYARVGQTRRLSGKRQKPHT